MTTKRAFEPWAEGGHFEGGWDIVPECGEDQPVVATVYTEEARERIIACVNALAGINPEAVAQMMEALGDIVADPRNRITPLVTWASINKARAALAAAKQE